LKEKIKQNLSLNFFCEKHGKSSRDQHFIERESLVKRLCSAVDICDAIHRQQEIANLDCERINSLTKKSGKKIYKIVKTFAFEITSKKHIAIKQTKQVENLKRYYNFFVGGDGIFKTHYMSDTDVSYILKFQDLNKPVDQITNVDQRKSVDFDQVKTKKFEFKTFKNKMVQWRILQKTPTTALNNFELNSSDENNSHILNDYEFCGNKCASCGKFFNCLMKNEISISPFYRCKKTIADNAQYIKRIVRP